MYLVSIKPNGRKTVTALTEARKDAVRNFTAQGFRSLFVRGYILTNAL